MARPDVALFARRGARSCGMPRRGGTGGALWHAPAADGERAIGEQVLREYLGRSWCIVKAHTDMRARAGPSQRPWGMGERESAIGHHRTERPERPAGVMLCGGGGAAPNSPGFPHARARSLRRKRERKPEAALSSQTCRAPALPSARRAFFLRRGRPGAPALRGLSREGGAAGAARRALPYAAGRLLLPGRPAASTSCCGPGLVR